MEDSNTTLYKNPNKKRELEDPGLSPDRVEPESGKSGPVSEVQIKDVHYGVTRTTRSKNSLRSNYPFPLT